MNVHTGLDISTVECPWAADFQWEFLISNKTQIMILEDEKWLMALLSLPVWTEWVLHLQRLLSDVVCKKEGVCSRKTSIIFNNYTYLQRCGEAKWSVPHQRYVTAENQDQVHSILDEDSVCFTMAITLLYCGFKDSQFICWSLQKKKNDTNVSPAVWKHDINKVQRVGGRSFLQRWRDFLLLQVCVCVSVSVCSVWWTNRCCFFISPLSICSLPDCKGPAANWDPLTQDHLINPITLLSN